MIAAKKRRKAAIIKRLFSHQGLLHSCGGHPVRYRFKEFAQLRKELWSDRKTAQKPVCIELEDIEPGTGRLLKAVQTSRSSSAKHCFYAGDILFGKLRPYLRKYLKPDFDGVCSSEIWVLAPDVDKVDAEYLYYLIQTDEFLRSVCVSTGSKMPRAEWWVVADRKFIIPGIETQKYTAAILTMADREIEGLERQRTLMDQQKRGLMQKLLTGEVRVKT